MNCVHEHRPSISVTIGHDSLVGRLCYASVVARDSVITANRLLAATSTPSAFSLLRASRCGTLRWCTSIFLVHVVQSLFDRAAVGYFAFDRRVEIIWCSIISTTTTSTSRVLLPSRGLDFAPTSPWRHAMLILSTERTGVDDTKQKWWTAMPLFTGEPNRDKRVRWNHRTAPGTRRSFN